MRIKIIGDGTVRGTQVVNAETGEPVDGVQRIEWTASIEGGAHATIYMVNTPVEIVANAVGPKVEARADVDEIRRALMRAGIPSC